MSSRTIKNGDVVACRLDDRNTKFSGIVTKVTDGSCFIIVRRIGYLNARREPIHDRINADRILSHQSR